MNAPEQKVEDCKESSDSVVLSVLRVGSPDVLGKTIPLSVAPPFQSKNAQGDLKKVDNLWEIQRIATESAASFRLNLKSC